MKKFYRGLVAFNLVLFIIYMLLPYSWYYLYDTNTLDALSWNGWGAHINIYGMVPWMVCFAFFVISIGLCFFKSWARISFLVYLVGSTLATPIWGVMVFVGIDSVVGGFIGLGNGFILALSYFSSMSREFNA